MPIDYRLDPFQDVLNAVTISGETHTIPSVSPFTIRLGEVPLKETPSSISLTIGGVRAEEVSSAPAPGQFWPDYSTGADGDDDWNTGTILFNVADAGKTVVVTYKGTGCVVWADFMNPHVFTESGTITAPLWATHAIVSGCGGGGGGGGCASGQATGAGGGAGGHCINYLIAVTGGQGYIVTIGAGGAGGAGTNVTGGTGGTTSFGDLLSLGGGKGGAGTASAPGSPGSGISSIVVLAASGTGGSSYFGNGGVIRTTSGRGNAASGYGSGGGGGAGGGNWGGAGSPGFFMIRWVRM